MMIEDVECDLVMIVGEFHNECRFKFERVLWDNLGCLFRIMVELIDGVNGSMIIFQEY